MKKSKKRLKIYLLSIVVLFTVIAQGQTLGITYAKELDKINNQTFYGDYYNQDINQTTINNTIIEEKTKPDIINKEPMVTSDIATYDPEQEIIELRSENTKTYQLSQGEYVTEFYFEQIHKEENGEFVEIDNDLTQTVNPFSRSAATTYENKDGLYDVFITNGNMNITNPEGDSLEIIIVGNVNNYAIKENVILYSEVENNMDVEYRIESNTIRQNLYINGTIENNHYSFQINKGNYQIETLEDGSINFLDGDRIVFGLLAP